jgi:hypothetical protein
MHKKIRRHEMKCSQRFEYREHTVTVCLADLADPQAGPAHRYTASYSVLPPAGAGPSWQEFSSSAFDDPDVAELVAAHRAKFSIDEVIGKSVGGDANP